MQIRRSVVSGLKDKARHCEYRRALQGTPPDVVLTGALEVCGRKLALIL